MKIYATERLSRLPDAVLFDLDNTLYPYDTAHKAAMDAVRGKMGAVFSVSGERFDHFYGEARRDVKERLKNTAASHSRLLYMQRLFEMIGLGSQPMHALDMEQTYWRAFLANAVLFDEVRELLDDIRLLGIPMAIVTDLTAQIQFRKLIWFNLDSFFQVVVTSEETAYDKPHPAPFLLALEKLQVKGGTVWMIGDSPSHDMRGAKEAIGAVTLQKIHTGISAGTGEEAPDAAFSRFGDLRNLIKKLGDK
jgi:putative hydrolase of the HAD superfamily